MLRVGQKFPYCKVKVYHNGEIKEINLEEYKGKWLVLVSHPAAFTTVCQEELSELSKIYDEFKKLGAELMSLSTDTVYTLKAWKESTDSLKNVEFPMISDATHNLTSTMGTYDENTGLTRRGTVIVNPEGIVMHICVNDFLIGRNTMEILRTLKACKFVYDNPGKACPPNWETELVKS
ncbi:MAG: peroxiredoxin [Candidatus Calescibacterium sp.]|nr:peroxiredoxin [Candidatus Calescibacterium sp.]MDW8195254.1 peroxiredoxin [Candidatus Calescibacterium sp.]